MPEKFGHNTYRLNEPLPTGVAAEILANARAFLEFLNSTKTTTHPIVRALQSGVELQIAGLVGLVEAEKVRERGGGEDEMDGWHKNGWTADCVAGRCNHAWHPPRTTKPPVQPKLEPKI